MVLEGNLPFPCLDFSSQQLQEHQVAAWQEQKNCHWSWLLGRQQTRLRQRETKQMVCRRQAQFSLSLLPSSHPQIQAMSRQGRVGCFLPRLRPLSHRPQLRVRGGGGAGRREAGQTCFFPTWAGGSELTGDCKEETNLNPNSKPI